MDSEVSSKTASRRGPFIGRPLPRFEDLRLVRGAGRYTDDLSDRRPGISRCSCARRTPMPASSRSMPSAARGRPGVLAVLTGADYVADGHIGMSHHPNPGRRASISRCRRFTPTPERKILDELQLPLAVDARALCRRGGRGRGGRDAAGRARRRRGGRGRIRGPAGRDRRRSRRSRPARRRSGRTRPAISRSTTRSAIAPRSRPRSRAPTSWSSRPSAASAPSAPSWSRARRSAATTRRRSNTR